MKASRAFQEVKTHEVFESTQPVDPGPLPVRVLPFPEAVTLPVRKTIREAITSRDTWHGTGLFLKKSVYSGASMLTRTATTIGHGLSSLPWRDYGRVIKRFAEIGASAIGATARFIADVISALPWRGLGRFSVKLFKLGIAMFLDLLDFTVGRLLGFGILFDLGCALITAALWGKRGWWCLLEVVDITEQIDGFVPSCTLIALRSWNDS